MALAERKNGLSVATTYLTPGVYVEEVPSGSASLSAGATAIAAFVGFTAKAPSDPSDPEGRKPRLVTNWSQFEQLFGGFAPGIMLPHSVYGWFNNGGGSCYIVRIPHTVPASEPSTLALPAADRALGSPIEIVTKEPTSDLVVEIRAGEEPDALWRGLVPAGVMLPQSLYLQKGLDRGKRCGSRPRTMQWEAKEAASAE